MITEVVNLEKLSRDGFKQPANNPAVSTPDNITHAQLRYNDFSSSYVVQGVAIYNKPSTFEFEISSAVSNSYQLFKLYVSTDGSSYTEDKSYGGDDGRTLNGLTSDILATNNVWTGTNAFNTSLPTSTLSGTTKNQFQTIKSAGISYTVRLNQASTSNPTVSTFANETGQTFAWTRVSLGYYRCRANTSYFDEASRYWMPVFNPFVLDPSGSVTGYVSYDAGASTGTDFFLATFGTAGIEVGILSLADEILANFFLEIKFFPLA